MVYLLHHKCVFAVSGKHHHHYAKQFSSQPTVKQQVRNFNTHLLCDRSLLRLTFFIDYQRYWVYWPIPRKRYPAGKPTWIQRLSIVGLFVWSQLHWDKYTDCNAADNFKINLFIMWYLKYIHFGIWKIMMLIYRLFGICWTMKLTLCAACKQNELGIFSVFRWFG